MKKILLFGEPMTMFVAETPGKLEEVELFSRSLAGAEVNVCIGLRRLGFDVAYATKLGKETFGKYILNRLKEEDLDISFVSYSEKYPSAFQLKGKALTGDPEVVYYRSGSAASHMTAEDIDQIDFDQISAVHVTGIPPALSLSCREATYRLIERAKQKELFVTFDPNLRPKLWENEETMISVINDLTAKCDVVLPGVEEGKILTGSANPEEICSFYQKSGVKTVIVKMGSKGAYVCSDNKKFTVDGYKVDAVVDTVGAGDGFAVGVISGRLWGLKIEEAVKQGNAIGAIQVMHKSDNEGLPTEAELKSFMLERSETT